MHHSAAPYGIQYTFVTAVQVVLNLTYSTKFQRVEAAASFASVFRSTTKAFADRPYSQQCGRGACDGHGIGHTVLILGPGLAIHHIYETLQSGEGEPSLPNKA